MSPMMCPGDVACALHDWVWVQDGPEESDRARGIWANSPDDVCLVVAVLPKSESIRCNVWMVSASGLAGWVNEDVLYRPSEGPCPF